MGEGETRNLNLLNKEQKMSLLKQGIVEDYKNSNVIFELRTDISEMFIVETEPESEMFNKFILIWGDYVANVWEEEYEVLSEATARMAQLIHVVEREPQGEIVGFAKYGDEFTSAWATFVKDTTVTLEN
jgi:ribosomal protein S18 acetylase RimI-like enzyme